MPSVRRNDYSPRVEMLPLIDVIFLLLTFFIYSMLVMVHANVLPVSLAPVGAEAPAEGEAMHAVTVDGQGRLYFDREPVTRQELDAHLAELAEDPSAPVLYLAVEAEGEVDRGPVLVRLIERVYQAGVENVAIVGQPREAGPQADGE